MRGNGDMTVLRCTAKLGKRLKASAKPEEPTPQANPLGEWYADIDFWHRQPFVAMLNAETGVALVLPGNAAGIAMCDGVALFPLAPTDHLFRMRGRGLG